MKFPRVALVASPDVDAEVRCDLNVDTSWPDGDAFSLGAPPLIGDPGGIGASYDFRTLSFNLAIKDGERRALAKQSELARELMRDENWLLFQLSPEASPVWFRCVRSSLGEVSMANVYLDRPTSLWTVAVSLVAYPFAYGEEVQQGVRLSNDPTADGGVAVVLRDAVGDAPAPLLISGVDQGDGTIYRPLIAVTPLSRWDGLQSWKPDLSGAWTYHGDGARGATVDAEASGGTAFHLDMTALAPADAQATVTPTQAGTYRLFARIKGTALTMTLVAGGAAALKTTTITGLPFGLLGEPTGYFYVDMGSYVFPRGNVPMEPGYVLAAGDGATVTLSASVSLGVESLVIDHIVAVPVELFEAAGDSRMFTLANNGLLGQRIDGEKARIGPIPGPTPITPRSSDQTSGDFPQIVPGAVNVLHLLTKVQRDAVPMSNVSEPLGTVTVLNIRYRPRHLYLAGG